MRHGTIRFTLALTGVSAFALTAQAQPGPPADPPPFRDNASVGVGASIDVEEVSSKVFFEPFVGSVPPTADGGFFPFPVARVHSAKFVCGQVPADEEHPEKPDRDWLRDEETHALTPGTYLTAINIFNSNPTGVPVAFNKFAFLAPAERAGDNGPLPDARGGGLSADGGEFEVVLQSGQAIEIDCLTITEELLGPGPSGVVDGENPVDISLRKGFVAILTPCGQIPPGVRENGSGPDFDLFVDLFCPELQVTAVYTYKNVEGDEDEDEDEDER